MKKIFLFLFVFLQFTFLNAHSFSNLGFEYWQRNEFPLFWQQQGVIIVSSDSINKLSGSYSLKATRQIADIEKDKSPYGLILQNIQTAFNYSDIENKEIEVSVYIKGELVDSLAPANVFIQVIDLTNPGNNNISIGDNTTTSNDWTKSSASITIGNITPTTVIYMGIIMTGYGNIWLDNYQIKLDNQLHEDVYPRQTNLTEEEKKWMKSNTISISNELFVDKKQFEKNIANARIIGIGDNVHGSSSIVRLKGTISKTLIENKDFTLLAIEDSPFVGAVFNRYILGFSDTIDQKDVNVMYSNKDFIALMSWLREYNRSTTKKVKIFGVDINSKYENQIEYINKVTLNKYSIQLDSINSIFKQQLGNWNPTGGDKIPFSEEQKQYFRENLELIKNNAALMNIEKDDKMLIYYYADNLLKYLNFSKQSREKHMADNIEWLLSNHLNEKIIYMAHNSHVGNSYSETKMTGAWLKELFKDEYYIIGTCYYEGTDMFKKQALRNSTNVINESVKGSYEYLFNQIDNDCFYLDMKQLKQSKNTSNEWLTKPMLIRDCGVELFNYYHEFSLTTINHQFDAVVFIKESVPL